MTLSFSFPIASKLMVGEEVEGCMEIATTTNSIRLFRDIATGSCNNNYSVKVAQISV